MFWYMQFAISMTAFATSSLVSGALRALLRVIFAKAYHKREKISGNNGGNIFTDSHISP